MHNIIGRVTHSQSRDRFNANMFEQTLSTHIYNMWVPAKEFGLIEGAVWTEPVQYRFPSWVMDTTNHSTYMDAVGAYVPKDRDWRSGIVCLVPHIMINDTGNVVLVGRVTAISAGAGPADWITYGSDYKKTISASPDIHGARVLSQSEYLNDNKWICVVDDSTVAFKVEFGRDCTDSADTCAGNVYFHGAVLKYIEGEKSIGELYDPVGR